MRPTNFFVFVLSLATVATAAPTVRSSQAVGELKGLQVFNSPKGSYIQFQHTKTASGETTRCRRDVGGGQDLIDSTSSSYHPRSEYHSCENGQANFSFRGNAIWIETWTDHPAHNDFPPYRCYMWWKYDINPFTTIESNGGTLKENFGPLGVIEGQAIC